MKQVENLLSEMTAEQKAPLNKILGLKDKNSKSILERLSKILLPVKGFWQNPLSYKEFLEKIAEKNNEKLEFSKNIVSFEESLYIRLYAKEFAKLTAEEKEQIFKELEKAGLDKNQIASLSGIAAIGAAQLSGFGIYVLASSTLGAITSMLGLTLPFAIYTGMSSLISFVIGPIGFLVMGIAIYRSFKNVKSWDEAVDIFKASWKEISSFTVGDYDRGLMAFKYIAATRIVLRENFNKEIELEKCKIEKSENENLQNHDVISKKEALINEINNKIQNKIIVKENIQNDIRKLEVELASVNNKIETYHAELRTHELGVKIRKVKISISNDLSEISHGMISEKHEKINKLNE